ncbi:TPA_asm: UL15 iORF 3 [Human alphaherpesvirus 1]|nr:TPA_asm: UL15 iORF 3 [Human alphaherpesvirus 1]
MRSRRLWAFSTRPTARLSSCRPPTPGRPVRAFCTTSAGPQTSFSTW